MASAPNAPTVVIDLNAPTAEIAVIVPSVPTVVTVVTVATVVIVVIVATVVANVEDHVHKTKAANVAVQEVHQAVHRKPTFHVSRTRRHSPHSRPKSSPDISTLVFFFSLSRLIHDDINSNNPFFFSPFIFAFLKFFIHQSSIIRKIPFKLFLFFC